MDNMFSDLELIKVNTNFENMQQILIHNGYNLDKSYYILDIYMINKNILDDVLNVSNINELRDYLILRDYNNESKEILLFNNEIIKGKIKGLFTTKYIIENLGYEQMFNINMDIYFYTNGNDIITVLDIKNTGLYIDKSDLGDLLESLNINYLENDNNDYINSIFLKYKEERKRGNV